MNLRLASKSAKILAAALIIGGVVVICSIAFLYLNNSIGLYYTAMGGMAGLAMIIIAWKHVLENSAYEKLSGSVAESNATKKKIADYTN